MQGGRPLVSLNYSLFGCAKKEGQNQGSAAVGKNPERVENLRRLIILNRFMSGLEMYNKKAKDDAALKLRVGARERAIR